MNPRDYRHAMDAIRFRPGFEQDTIARLLEAAARPHGKDASTMKTRRITKIALIAAMLALALAVSAAAAVLLLRPDEVAEALGDAALADALASPDAVLCNETVVSGDYAFTLAGTVSGAGLSDFAENLDESRTYAVVCVRKTDGTPFDEAGFDFTVSPLIAGCDPQRVNLFTLGAGGQCIIRDGTLYYLYDYQDLAVFADRTVYLAVYSGMLPPKEQFSLSDDGSIRVSDDSAPCALFTLPLDPSGADPDAADAIVRKALALQD